MRRHQSLDANVSGLSFCGREVSAGVLSLFFVFLLIFLPSCVWADSSDLATDPAAVVLDIIVAREVAGQGGSVLSSSDMKIMTSPDVFSVSVTVPLAAFSDDNSVESEFLNIATNFYRQSSGVDKRVFIDAPDSKYMFNARMNLPLGAKPFTNEVIEKDHRSWLVYDNGTDVIAYNLGPDAGGGVAQKEWIYARTPNSPDGSRYDWTFETMGRRVQLKEMPDGRVGLHHDILINGMDNDDEIERQRLLGVVRMALPEAYIVESPLTAIFEPIVFWTSDGVPREGKYVLTSRNTLTVAVKAHPQEYPLLIDPTINYGAWLGSNEGMTSSTRAIAVNAEEIYVGGYSTGFFSVSATMAGTFSSSSEAWVVEIADGNPPAVSWLHWLGGRSGEQVLSLAVNGDEVYAGGYSQSLSSWETAGFIVGTINDTFEGFVVEISDGTPPTLAWLQWLGGGSSDNVYALAVNGDEVYAGGYSLSFTSWETVGATAGTYNANNSEGWVVEIADGSPPTIAWLHWLGGGSNDQVYALIVNGDEVYAGGQTLSFTSWETVSLEAGTYNPGANEGWVVEITDGSPPDIAWLQWLGGSANDVVYALAVNGDEVYAGGSASLYTSWETVGAEAGTCHASVQGSEAFVVEIADGSPPVVAWLHWLGGSSTDQVYALAVNGDEVYAGGSTSSYTSWQRAGSVVGTHNAGSVEGWVVEITDGSPPILAWLQWLGGFSTDTLYALAVNSEEVYAGGDSASNISWETVGSVVGTGYAGSSPVWIVEVADGAPPVAAWLQWLGGSNAGSCEIKAMAVNGDEIYTGGSAGGSTWPGAVETAGTFNQGNIGSFVFRAKILGLKVHNADGFSARSNGHLDTHTPFALSV